MPDYLIKVSTNAILDREGLDHLENVVYDVLTHTYEGSIDVVADGGGVTDVEAVFD